MVAKLENRNLNFDKLFLETFSYEKIIEVFLKLVTDTIILMVMWFSSYFNILKEKMFQFLKIGFLLNGVYHFSENISKKK